MHPSIFDLRRLRAEVALQQVLAEHPHRPPSSGQSCPFCQSKAFVKYCFENGKQRYRCQSCRRRFTERPIFECDCAVVGHIPKCQDCPYFKGVMQAAKERIKGLADWSVEELEAFLASRSPGSK